MCCHFKATHEPYDFPERMRHLYDGVVFPEPENLLDWGPETNGRTFVGQKLETIGYNWRWLRLIQINGGVVIRNFLLRQKE